MASVGRAKRAAALISQAWEVCMAAGRDVIMGHECAGAISEVLRDSFAPEAAASVNQGVARGSQFERTTQSTDEDLVRFDLPPRKAVSRMQIGGTLPGFFAPALCVQYASFSWPGESLAPASVQGNVVSLLVFDRCVLFSDHVGV